MIRPALVSIYIRQGADFDLPLQVVTGPEGQEEPVDLTGCTFKMQVRKTRERESALLLEASTSEGTITTTNPETEANEPENGWILVRLPATITANLASRLREGWYDLLIIHADSGTNAYIEGPAEIAPGTTVA